MTMDNIVKLLKALSDRNRLRIIAGLMEQDELCACQITELLQVSGATASRHLTILSNARLVSARKSGRWIYYKLQRESINHHQILEWLQREFDKTEEIATDRTTLAKIVSSDPEELCRKQRGVGCCPKKIKLLFLCTGNSCRSQMAEGWTRHLKGDWIDVYSAGIETHGLNPNAVKVMAEAGIDITGQKSQLLSEFDTVNFDYVVTVCSHAHDNCPVFSGNAKVVHLGFPDPPKMAHESASTEEILDCFRQVRNEIKLYVETLPKSLNKEI
jgi:arsenate reductase (thioredoxin)